MKELRGICCALCSPFSEDGEHIDEPALLAHIDSMLEAGMHGILICGGTGEFAMLRPDERRRLVEVAARHIDGNAFFMVHTSTTSTAEGIELARHAAGTGADAILVLPPYFEGPDADGVYDHYERIAAAVTIPVVAYNIPVHTGFDITPEFFARLMQIDNLQHIKDSTADLIRIQELLSIGAKVFNGGDPIAFHALVAGCVGCVWGGPNAMPHEAVALYELVKSGRLAEASDLWKRLFPVNRFFWRHVYNAAVKAATNLSGRPVGPCRRPVRPLSESQLAELRRAMAALNGRSAATSTAA